MVMLAGLAAYLASARQSAELGDLKTTMDQIIRAIEELEKRSPIEVSITPEAAREIGAALAAATAIGAITLSPEAIIDFIQVGAPQGQLQVFGFAVPIACAAGTTVTWSFRLPRGWVSIARTPYRFTSDFYDVGLTVQLLIEEEMRSITWGALPMTGPREVLFDFTPKAYGMDVIITNGTATDALVTGEATVVWVERSYWENFYKPVMAALYRAAEGVTK